MARNICAGQQNVENQETHSNALQPTVSRRLSTITLGLSLLACHERDVTLECELIRAQLGLDPKGWD